jgi:hypothetical protein
MDIMIHSSTIHGILGIGDGAIHIIDLAGISDLVGDGVTPIHIIIHIIIILIIIIIIPIIITTDIITIITVITEVTIMYLMEGEIGLQI